MRRTLPTAVLLWLTASALPTPASGQQPAPWMHRVMAQRDTSSYPPMPALSPDNRWLVWATDPGDEATELWIRAREGGEARPLFTVKGLHRWPTFTPQGDRLVFASSLPRRSAGEDGLYLMAAPFDTRTGTLSAPPRQVTLEPVRPQPRFRWAFSPDGQRVVYMNARTPAAQVVPITGGTATTLVSLPSMTMFLSLPGGFQWSADGSTVSFQMRKEGEPLRRYRVPAHGGPLTALGQAEAVLTRPVPGTDLFLDWAQGGRGGSARVTFLNGNGERVGAEVPLKGITGNAQIFPSTNGKYLIVTASDVLSAIRIVPTAGGPIRTPAEPTGYDWPIGWTEDSRTVYAAADIDGKVVYRGASVDGRVTMSTPMSPPNPAANMVGNLIVEQEIAVPRPIPGTPGAIRLFDPATGARRPFTRGVFSVCCRAPGGGYNSDGSRFYYSKQKGQQLQVWVIDAAGHDSLVTSLPMSLVSAQIAVGIDRVAWLEQAGDSVRLQVQRGGGSVSTLATYPKVQFPGPGELTWSRDGRQLALSVADPNSIHVFTVNASGHATGPAQRMALPFRYQYDLFWLPDGSGMTMIAQPVDRPTTVVALAKLADPTHPVLLTADDPHFTWGHVLSPDGKYDAYQSERPQGGSVWLVEVAALLAEARKGKD